MTRVSGDNFVIKKRYNSLYLPIEIGVTKYSVIISEAYPLASNRGWATNVL